MGAATALAPSCWPNIQAAPNDAVEVVGANGAGKSMVLCIFGWDLTLQAVTVSLAPGGLHRLAAGGARARDGRDGCRVHRPPHLPSRG